MSKWRPKGRRITSTSSETASIFVDVRSPRSRVYSMRRFLWDVIWTHRDAYERGGHIAQFSIVLFLALLVWAGVVESPIVPWWIIFTLGAFLSLFILVVKAFQRVHAAEDARLAAELQLVNARAPKFRIGAQIDGSKILLHVVNTSIKTIDDVEITIPNQRFPDGSHIQNVIPGNISPLKISCNPHQNKYVVIARIYDGDRGPYLAIGFDDPAQRLKPAKSNPVLIKVVVSARDTAAQIHLFRIEIKSDRSLSILEANYAEFKAIAVKARSLEKMA